MHLLTLVEVFWLVITYGMYRGMSRNINFCKPNSCDISYYVKALDVPEYMGNYCAEFGP